jgi:hypothetical protein
MHEEDESKNCRRLLLLKTFLPTQHGTVSNVQASRMPTWNVTLNNIEAHAKTGKTEPEKPSET